MYISRLLATTVMMTICLASIDLQLLDLVAK